MNTKSLDRLDVLSLRKLLIDLKAALPPEIEMNGMRDSLGLAAAILKHYFGIEWFTRWVMPETAKRNFLRLDESEPKRLDLTALRVIDLAEVIYNLQHVPGFDECIIKMKNGDIEGTYAELDLGRMLYLNKVPFRYVVARGVTTMDYDVEVEFPNGMTACAEAKCSIDSTALGETTVRNRLNKAHGQLPPDRPGIIFVKMPPRWMNEDGFADMVVDAARDFLRTHGRIVSVKFYTSPFSFENGYLKLEHAYKEVSNPDTRFGRGQNWNLFRQWNLPSEYNGMPPHWQRVLFFPDGKMPEPTGIIAANGDALRQQSA